MASSDSPKPLVDLYGDDNPPLYFEDKVDPKSFRNRLISVLIWTSCLPLILLIFFQQKNFATATDMQNNLQLGLAREAVLYIESDVSSIKSQLTLALSTYALQPRSSAARGTFENLLRHNPIIRSLSYSDEFGHTTLLASPYAVETHAAGTSGQFALQISQSFRNGSSPRSLTAYLDTGMLAHSLSNLLYGRTYAGALFNHNRELVYATPADSAQRKAAAENFTPAEKQRLDTAGGTPFVLRTPGDRFASHIKVFVPIPSLGWTLVLSESQYARDEAMRDMAVIWALGFFVALVGTFVLATLLSMPIARSINALAEAVEKYARTGRFTRLGKELTALGTTEIVTLEETFARMVEVKRLSETSTCVWKTKCARARAICWRATRNSKRCRRFWRHCRKAVFCLPKARSSSIASIASAFFWSCPNLCLKPIRRTTLPASSCDSAKRFTGGSCCPQACF